MSINLAKDFREDFFKWPITTKNCIWRVYKSYDRHEIWTFCTGFPILQHSYKVTIHFAS